MKEIVAVNTYDIKEYVLYVKEWSRIELAVADGRHHRSAKPTVALRKWTGLEKETNAEAGEWSNLYWVEEYGLSTDEY